jgi:glycosyltransferase involved in cell wall biosynthesis
LFIASLPPEIEEIRTFVGGRRSDIWVVPNPIPAPPSVSSLMPMLTEDAVFLGRFDVLHKGIDRLIALAELMPDITFGLYGSGDRTEMPGLPDNVRVHEPVFGIDKWRLLASARMYVQLSRWESFGMSIFEAMMVGTPPVVADSMHAAKTVCDLGGLSIDTRNLTTEAGHVRRLLDQATTDLSHNELMASRAKSFVDPISVARQVCTAYEHALKA